MEPFRDVTGIAAHLPAPNIDTDVIMPKTFLKGVDRNGLGRGLFHDLRFDFDGGERDDFVLNREPWRSARFLVVGPNFGCGSSREHAVWGLQQFGVRALIGTSFAGIFFDNCANNGVPAIILGEEAVRRLGAAAEDAQTATLTVSLVEQVIVVEATGERIRFAIEPARREALLSGLDAIGQTLAEADAIRAFERRHFGAHPWLA